MAEIYREGQRPDDAEVAERRERYWRPYHDKVAAALGAIKARHGFALLWDAHSIRSVLPRFFEGRLTDLNLGTGDGRAAPHGLLDARPAVDKDAEPLRYSQAADGRSQGGYITRRQGRPAAGSQVRAIEGRAERRAGNRWGRPWK